jgi:hypothetical protein
VLATPGVFELAALSTMFLLAYTGTPPLPGSAIIAVGSRPIAIVATAPGSLILSAIPWIRLEPTIAGRVDLIKASDKAKTSRAKA